GEDRRGDLFRPGPDLSALARRRHRDQALRAEHRWPHSRDGRGGGAFLAGRALGRAVRLTETAVKNIRHIVIDMQRLFAEETPWHTPSIGGIIGNVTALSKAHAGRTLFAKFMLPATPEQ